MPIIFTHFWAKTETETIFCFGQYRNRKGFYSFGKTDIQPNGQNSAENRNRICFGRTLGGHLGYKHILEFTT